MKNCEGYEIKASYVESSFSDDFASLQIGRPGYISVSVYPLSSADLRILAGELIYCADRLDAKSAANAQFNAQFNAAMLADEREAA